LAGSDKTSKALWIDIENRALVITVIRGKIDRVLDEVDADPRNWTIFIEGILDEALLFIREINFGTMRNQMVNKGL
jgi:hypothetical protein